MAGYDNALPPGLRGYMAGTLANQRTGANNLGMLNGILSLQGQMENRIAAQQQQENMRGILGQITDPGARMMAQAGDIKGALARQFPDAGARFDKINPANFTPDSLAAFTRSGSHADLVPVRKRESVTTRDETGNPVTAFIDPYAQNAPMAQPVKQEMVPLGGTVAPVNPYTQNAPLRRTVSPDASLQAGVTVRGQNMVDARSREANTIAGDNRLASDVTSLRKEFNDMPEVKNYRTVAPIIESVKKAPNTSAGDLDLIYGVGKILDPTSVVREGEMALVIKSGSPVERFKGATQYVMGGGRLSPQQRLELSTMLEGRVSQIKAGHDAATNLYRNTAKAKGLPEDQIFMEPFGRRANDAEAEPKVRRYNPATGRIE